MPSFFFDFFFLVSYDDFVVGDFDEIFAGDDKLGLKKGFDWGAFDENLLDGESISGDTEANDFAEFGAFFGFDFEPGEAEIEGENSLDFDDIVGSDELVYAVYSHGSHDGVGPADGSDVENIGVAAFE